MLTYRQMLCKLGDTGQFFPVKFIKKDGTERTMLCKFTKMGQTGEGMTYDPEDYNLLPVMDLHLYQKNLRDGLDKEESAKRSYRMINIATLLEIKGVKIGNE